MRITNLLAFAALTAGAIAATQPAHAKSKCVRAGGEASMLTEDLARFMANAALNNSIKGMGATASGKASMACKTDNGLVHCVAKQKACK
jgi:hypothetical protein